MNPVCFTPLNSGHYDDLFSDGGDSGRSGNLSVTLDEISKDWEKLIIQFKENHNSSVSEV